MQRQLVDVRGNRLALLWARCGYLSIYSLNDKRFMEPWRVGVRFGIFAAAESNAKPAKCADARTLMKISNDWEQFKTLLDEHLLRDKEMPLF